MEIKIKKLKPYAITPSYAHKGDAGMDLFSAENYVIEPGKRGLISTGIATEFPLGYVALVWDKSGLAVKNGIKTMAGVIDHGYRGEWKIALLNTSKDSYEIKRGDKIAQVLIQKVEYPDVVEVQDLSDTERGEGGFGSTGK